jgi:electron-transferring-flavoprotein dehydrogenase
MLACRAHRASRALFAVRTLRTTARRANESGSEREKFDPTSVERVQDDVDVCIVGAGPAGLSAAIRLKQLEQEKGREIRVVVLEKGGEVGTSVLQGPARVFSLTVLSFH